MKIRVMLFGFSEEDREGMSAILYNTEAEIIKNVNDYGRLPDEVDREKPDILLIYAIADRKLMSVSKQIYIIYPHCIQVLLANERSSKLYAFAMEAGIKKVVAPIPDAKDFIVILKELYLNENSREANLIEAARDIIRTENIVVMGAKGGIGKTTLAVNIAVQLATAKKKVALLDLNTQFGDITLFLGLDAKNTISELLEEQKVPTIDVVEDYLLLHQSGVRVLASPKSPEYAESISGKQVEDIIKALQNYYDYVIIDAAMGFGDLSLRVLDLANKIFFLTNTEICTLRNSKKALLLLTELNLEDKINLIMLEDRKKSVLTVDVEQVLGYDVVSVISNDSKTSTGAINQAMPVVIQSPETALGRDLIKIAGMINSSSGKVVLAAGGRPAGLLGLFKSRKK